MKRHTEVIVGKATCMVLGLPFRKAIRALRVAEGVLSKAASKRHTEVIVDPDGC